MSDEAPRYTIEDLHAGRCSFADVGEPIPAAPADSTITPDDDEDEDHQQARQLQPALPDFSSMSDAEIAQTSVRLLREATVEVFHRIGAADWLYQLARTNPKEFLKMLQRLLPQSIEQNISITSFEVPAHIRSLSLEDLKAMRSNPAANVSHAGAIDVEFREVPR